MQLMKIKKTLRNIIVKTWTLDVKEHPDGDKFIEFNDEILAETGWKEGDQLRWIDNGDGSWTLEKIMDEENELVMVECVSQYRMRYLVEVPKGKAEWALDTVTMEEAKEFSQLHVGETIMSHRVIDRTEALRVFDEDNAYAKDWSEQKKLDVSVTWRKEYE